MHDFDSIYYATVLYNDGIKKGWLKLSMRDDDDIS